MFDVRELAAVLAALLFRSEEIAPSGNDTARHYFKSVEMSGAEPRAVKEIQRLSARLLRAHRSK